MSQPFWERKSLAEMDDAEWEALCDHCGLCCLVKLQDEDSEQIAVTKVICEQYDLKQSRCACYQERCSKVFDCVDLKRHDFSEYRWMPATCAYRLLAQNQPLPEWHPLLTGRTESVREAGQFIPPDTLKESQVADLEDYITHWIS